MFEGMKYVVVYVIAVTSASYWAPLVTALAGMR